MSAEDLLHAEALRGICCLQTCGAVAWGHCVERKTDMLTEMTLQFVQAYSVQQAILLRHHKVDADGQEEPDS